MKITETKRNIKRIQTMTVEFDPPFPLGDRRSPRLMVKAEVKQTDDQEPYIKFYARRVKQDGTMFATPPTWHWFVDDEIETAVLAVFREAFPS